jgi:chorismate dehydratase
LTIPRISVVEFLNAAPLVWGLSDGPLAGRYDISFALPSQCAERLKNGLADVALIPAVEYQRIEGLVMLPGMAVAANGEVRSILLVSKKPMEHVRRVALDTSSRSSAGLVRLLCSERWGITPEFIDTPPDASAMLAEADAALIIGDPALRLALRMDEVASRLPTGERCCQGDALEMPVPGYETIFVYDVAFQWKEMTGLPCVLAVWVARPQAVSHRLLQDLAASRNYGLEHIQEIAEGASLKLDLPVAALESYLRNNIDFSLDAENLAGLTFYYHKCAAAGLIPNARPIEFAIMEGGLAAQPLPASLA